MERHARTAVEHQRYQEGGIKKDKSVFSFKYAIIERHMNKLITYTDGGSRGNPGPSAIGIVFMDPATQKVLHTYGERVENGTNNEAEYKAIIFALRKAKALVGKDKAKKMEVEMRMDSELAVRQLSGIYKLSTEHIQKLFIEVWNLKTDFAKVTFTHVRREQNTLADAALNRALDESASLFD